MLPVTGTALITYAYRDSSNISEALIPQQIDPKAISQFIFRRVFKFVTGEENPAGSTSTVL